MRLSLSKNAMMIRVCAIFTVFSRRCFKTDTIQGGGGHLETCMRAKRTLTTIAVLASISLTLCGCYEETGSAPAQSQAPAPPPQPGPLMSIGQQPASSALGKAKRTAGNTIDQAEQKSREDARQAEEMMNPKSSPTNDDPGM